MSEKVYDVPPEWKKRAYIDAAKYKEMYERSLKDPNGCTGTRRRPRSRTAPSVPATSRSSGSRTAC